MWASYTSFFKGFKQMYSVCGLFEGAKESDGKSDSILKIDSCFWSVGSAESEMDNTHLYTKRWVLVNQNEDFDNW